MFFFYPTTGSSTVLYEFSLARVKDMSQNESVKIEAARISLSTMGEVSETRHTTYSNKEDCVQFTVMRSFFFLRLLDTS